MNKLYIENNGQNIPVAELELILNKQQTVIGNSERDLILRTAGNIKIQVGNKFYDLPINTDGDGGSNTTIGGVIVLDNDSQLSPLPYPGDGSLIYIKQSGSFYIAVNGAYVKINQTQDDPTNPELQKIYLSFTEDQSLKGTQKYRVLLNSGYLVNKLDDVQLFTSNTTYPGQVIFSIEDGNHYQLTDTENPSIPASWKKLYLSTSGGTINGQLIIDATVNGNLSIIGEYPNTYLPINETDFKGIFLGNDYGSGSAIWTNSGTTYITAQDINAGVIKFLTQGSIQNGNVPLTLGANSVGVGYIDYAYNFNVGGTSQFVNTVYLNSEMKSKDFLSGMNGVGFSLGRDFNNKWTLEVDRLIVREQNNTTTDMYKTKAVDGSFILDFSSVLSEVWLSEEIPLYLNKNTVGLYNSDGSIKPLVEKYKYAYVLRTPIADLEDPSVGPSYELIEVPYGVGDRDASGNLAPYTLYIKDEDDNLVIPEGNYTYDPVAEEFIEDPAGDLVLMDTISLYKVNITGTASSLSVGDLLYYRQWDEDKNPISTSYVEVKEIVDEDIYVYTYNNTQLDVETVLIKLGNITDDECLIQLNSGDKDNPYIEMASDITSFNDFIENVYYDRSIIEIATEFKKAQIRLRSGDLSKIEDEDLDLVLDNGEKGLYSDNAYLKGNFVSIKHLMGDQLWFEGGVLWIHDLEIVKARNIIGANGLNGGGVLFDTDITINHNLGSWTTKANLSGGTVISNLSVDTYGHITNWTTRDLTTSDIPEGSRLYYTDVRVDNRINIQKGVPGGITPLNASAKVDEIYLPDSILGQLQFGGTYDGVVIAATSNYPELDGQPLPSASAYEGVFFIATAPFTLGSDNYLIGDWVLSIGSGWIRIPNSDAVTSVFGRVGNVLANSSDYAAFYYPLSANPAGYITALDLAPYALKDGSNATGTWSINISGTAATAGVANSVLWSNVGDKPQPNNWSTKDTAVVVSYLTWKNYGNNHIIFDASAGTAPDGSTISNVDSANVWTPNYGNFMGWNGSTTYGVKVDRARLAEDSTRWSTLLYSGSAGVVNTYLMAYQGSNTFGVADVSAVQSFLGLGTAAYYNEDINATGGSVVRRDGSGYVKAVYFNAPANSASPSTTGLSSLAGHQTGGDGYYYDFTAGAVGAWLGNYGGFLTAESDTLQTVTNRGASTTNLSYFNGGLRTSGGSGTGYSTADLEIYRAGTSPVLGFHWGGTVASTLRIDSSGNFLFMDNPGTAYQAVLTGALSVSGSAGISSSLSVGTSITAGTTVTAIDFNTTTGWYYSNAATGWFNNTYGGGIHMNDTTWVRVYNGKAFLVENTVRATDFYATGAAGYGTANYGVGLVGLYAADRYQEVFSMGAAYRPSTDGTSIGTSYGILWTHENVGGQSKAGLGHQMLITNNAVTTAAIGTGIWTSGVITGTSNLAISGTGSFGGNVSSNPAPTIGDHLANKTYVDAGDLWEAVTGTQIQPKSSKGVTITYNTSGAQTLLVTNGSTGDGIKVQSNGRAALIQGTSSSQPALQLSQHSSGPIAYFYANTTLVATISVAGAFTASGGFFDTSDIRYKNIVEETLDSSLIETIHYRWKDNPNKLHVGYSAQEVQRYMPDAINIAEDGKLSVNYTEVLVSKVAKLEQEVKELKERIGI